jgi:hypothetical protein
MTYCLELRRTCLLVDLMLAHVSLVSPPAADPIERFGSQTVVLGGVLGVLGCGHVIHARRPVCSRPVEFRTVVPHCRRCDLFRRY